MKASRIRDIVGHFAQIPGPDPRQVVVADTVDVPRIQRASGYENGTPGHQIRQPIQRAWIDTGQKRKSGSEGPVVTKPHAVQQCRGKNMSRFQSQKLVARFILCPENTCRRRSPIPPIIKRISAEDGVFGGKTMIDPCSKVIFFRRAESGVMIFRDSLHRIHHGAVGHRPESVDKRSYRRDGRCSHGCCRDQ